MSLPLEFRLSRRQLAETLAIIGVALLGTRAIMYAQRTAELEGQLVAVRDRFVWYIDSTSALCVLPDKTGHPDARLLQLAAQRESIPPLILFGLAAAETQYSGRNDLLGKSGEIGRLQITPSYWAGTSPECDELGDPESNARCGAQIARWCFQQTGSWTEAVRCYNQTSRGPRTLRYLASVERELGRMVLRGLDP